MKNPVCFLVDDDDDDREIFNLALENADSSYNCITAHNGPEALKILHEDSSFKPRFIFIDLNMPYMSGKEFLAEIKRDERLCDIPAIIYTTSSYNKDVKEAQDLGATHFLVKPSSINILTSLLSNILHKNNLSYFLE